MLSYEVYRLLVTLTNSLSENDVKYWLDGGTLLGIYREKQLIEYDSDMDLGLYEDSFEGDNKRKIINIMNSLNWFETDTYNHKMKFRYNDSSITIDFFKFQRALNYYYHYGFGGYMYYDLKTLDNLVLFNCNDDTFSIPNNADKYLESVYGTTWKYPNPDFKKPRDYNNYVKHYEQINSNLKKKIIIFDVDGTLTEPRQVITNEMKDYLNRMKISYNVFIVGAGSCKRIYSQLNNLDNFIFYGNYGLECAIGSQGILRYIYRERIKNNDIGSLKMSFDRIRKQFNLTSFSGDSYEIHHTGMITFALLGTTASISDKLKFDKDRRIREKIYPVLKSELLENNLIIGGTSSFDILPKNIDKTYGILKILESHDRYLIDELFFVGDDWHKFGNDYAVLKTGMKCFKVSQTTETIKLIEFLINYRMTLERRVIHWEIENSKNLDY